MSVLKPSLSASRTNGSLNSANWINPREIAATICAVPPTLYQLDVLVRIDGVLAQDQAQPKIRIAAESIDAARFTPELMDVRDAFGGHHNRRKVGVFDMIIVTSAPARREVAKVAAEVTIASTSPESMA